MWRLKLRIKIMTIQDAGLQLLSMGNMTIYKESLIQSMKQLDS